MVPDGEGRGGGIPDCRGLGRRGLLAAEGPALAGGGGALDLAAGAAAEGLQVA